MKDSTRRRFLRTGSVVGITGVTGCSQITGGNDIKDTDGDGVIDSEDYAPRDASVQDAEDVEEADSTEPDEEEEQEDSTTTETEIQFRDDFNYDSYQSNWRIREDHDGPIVSISVEDSKLIHIVDGGSTGGNIISNQSFDSAGTVRIEAELIRRNGGGGFGIHFGEYGTESEVLIGDGSNGLQYTVFPSDNRRGIVVDSQSGSENETVTYSLTLDFDSKTLTEISRDGRTYSPNVSFSDVYADSFSIEIGNGRNHNIEYEYVKIEDISG